MMGEGHCREVYNVPSDVQRRFGRERSEFWNSKKSGFTTVKVSVIVNLVERDLDYQFYVSVLRSEGLPQTDIILTIMKVTK